MGIEIAGIGLIWYGVAAGVVAGISYGTAAYSAGQEDKRQKKLLAAQDANVQRAEKKAASAKSLAAQESADKMKKQRMAQTDTILTSPLGISEEATVGATTLGGL